MNTLRIATAAVFALGASTFAQTPTPSTGGQTSTQTQRPSTSTASGQEQPITVTGCVQREADYRQAQNIGRGGAAGTGIGQGNEYVLIDATTASASGSSRTGGAPGSTTGSSSAGAPTTGSSTGGSSTTGGASPTGGSSTTGSSTSGSSTNRSGSSASGGAASSAGQSPSGTASSGQGARSMMAYELTGSQEGQLSSHVGQRVEITGTLKAAETGSGGNATGGATANVPTMRGDLRLREIEVTSVRAAQGGACPRSSN